MANGANISAVTDEKFATIFNWACERRSLSFLQELADKVTPDHISTPTIDSDRRNLPEWVLAVGFAVVVLVAVLAGAAAQPRADGTAWSPERLGARCTRNTS